MVWCKPVSDCIWGWEIAKLLLAIKGLDNAGKTTVAKALSGDNINSSSVPTIGFQKYEAYGVQLFELGGSESIRELWPMYFSKAFGFIFVVDSSSDDRFVEACQVLSNAYTDEHFKKKPLLLLGNKQDLENAADEQTIVTKLGLNYHANASQTPTRVESCIGNKEKIDPAIVSGFKWLLREIRGNYSSLQSRVQTSAKNSLKVNPSSQEKNASLLTGDDGYDDKNPFLLRNRELNDNDEDKNPFLPIGEVICRKAEAWTTTTNWFQDKLELKRGESTENLIENEIPDQDGKLTERGFFVLEKDGADPHEFIMESHSRGSNKDPEQIRKQFES
ncbi:ADP-ribosylation factor-like protein 13B isoform X2 [Artemia franciscana]|uniref:ADP-ribosylation factor-like protein 13B isoform X2 n=1 Tax=Artemia franciscana TaxID=6661 RepID=UPI0032DBEC1F